MIKYHVICESVSCDLILFLFSTLTYKRRWTCKISLDFIGGEDVLGTIGVDNDLSSNMTFHSFSFWTCFFYVFLADSGCPFGWMITDNSCFYFSNFTDPTQILTWSQAKQWCASKSFPAGNAKLVTLDNVNDGVSPFFL